MKVLLVDDEEDLVATLAERLSFRGIEADWSTTALQAMVKSAKCVFDVAVLDVKMPHVGGIELKKMLEKTSPHMKFIFLTGHGSEEDFVAGSTEAAHYLVKPLDIESLIKVLQEVVTDEA